MTYDFDTPVDRTGTHSLKWDEAGAALPMWVADMDFPTAPAVREALRRRADHGVFGYSDVPDAWAGAYASWWGSRHGLDIDASWLTFCTGVVPALSSIVRKLTTPAENVVILTPVYNIFFNSIRNNGRNALESPLAYADGRYAIDWADLEAKLADPQTSLMILCNPHNPTGTIWDRETLARIGELCWDHHVVVVSDEIHCDLTDPGHEYVPFATVSDHCRMNSITCIAPTKAFNIAGLQTAATMTPNPLLRHRVWRGLNTDEVAEPNAFAIDATIAAFTEGGPWLDELRGYLQGNKRVVRTALDEYNASAPQNRRVLCVPSEATYLLWIDCSALCDDTQALCDHLLADQGLMLSPGAQFGGNGRLFVRLNTATQRDRVRDGVRRLVDGLNSFDPSRVASDR